MYRMEIEREDDIFLASSLGKKVAENFGFNKIEQTKLVVSIIELTRNIILYAKKGELYLKCHPSVGIEIVAIDQGPGIKNLDQIFSQSFRSKTGLGLGLSGVKRLMDEFDIETDESGTRIRAVKFLHEGKAKEIGDE